MARDIEEFLRQAALRRQQQQQRQAAQPAPRQQSAPNAGGGRQSQQPKKRVRKGTSAPAAQVDRLVPSESVAAHVKRHLDTSSLTDHARQLGSEVALADDKLIARLHEKFDHDLGSLAETAAAPPAGKQSDASGKFTPGRILELLKNPVGLRQALIISEILKRPDFD